MTVDVLADLQARGLIAQMTAEESLRAHMLEASRTVYSGFDPTADSLHIGSLVPVSYTHLTLPTT